MTPQRPVPLSVFIICKNEADRIGRTIEAVRGPVRRHRRRRLRFHRRHAGGRGRRRARASSSIPFAGYGPQKRYAETAVPARLDAEHRRRRGDPARPRRRDPRALRGQGEPDADAYRIRIAEIFPGEGAPHRFAYALSPVRLYRRDKGATTPRRCTTGSTSCPAHGWRSCGARSTTSPCARWATRWPS